MLGARGGRIAALGTLAALVVAVVLRWQALGTAYWFDELWSIRHALAATSLAELYARAHDNNHLLNTVAIYWVGSRDAVLAYRALPFAAGLAVLVLAIADRGLTPLQRLVRTLVLGVSPLLVLLSSEARGYAPALAAALAVWQLLRRRFGAIDGTGSWLPVAGLNLLLPLGLASHLIFVHVYVAAFLFAVYALRSRGAPAGESARELTALFALPGSLAALHAVFFVLPMETGGGPDFTVAEFATRLVAFAIGIPEWSALCAVVGLFVAVLFGQHLARLRRAGDPRWVFDSVVVLVSPLIAPLLFSPGVIAVRYFGLASAMPRTSPSSLEWDAASTAKRCRRWRTSRLAVLRSGWPPITIRGPVCSSTSMPARSIARFASSGARMRARTPRSGSSATRRSEGRRRSHSSGSTGAPTASSHATTSRTCRAFAGTSIAWKRAHPQEFGRRARSVGPMPDRRRGVACRSSEIASLGGSSARGR